tara:strand:+ start:41330 stop:41722 length:393 start_codon:yes stop_codon:yes gene_type:complete
MRDLTMKKLLYALLMVNLLLFLGVKASYATTFDLTVTNKLSEELKVDISGKTKAQHSISETLYVAPGSQITPKYDVEPYWWGLTVKISDAKTKQELIRYYFNDTASIHLFSVKKCKLATGGKRTPGFICQ